MCGADFLEPFVPKTVVKKKKSPFWKRKELPRPPFHNLGIHAEKTLQTNTEGNEKCPLQQERNF